MSVSFQGHKKRGMNFPPDLNVTNGLAGRLLKAIGYRGSYEHTHGEMDLKAALAGIEKAKTTLSDEDKPFLLELEAICVGLKEGRKKTLVWF